MSIVLFLGLDFDRAKSSPKALSVAVFLSYVGCASIFDYLRIVRVLFLIDTLFCGLLTTGHNDSPLSVDLHDRRY